MRENIVRENYQRNSIKVLYIGGKLNPSDMENIFLQIILFSFQFLSRTYPTIIQYYVLYTYVIPTYFP